MSKIMPIFLAYMFAKMEVSFTGIRTLEEGPGKREFYEFSLSLY